MPIFIVGLLLAVTVLVAKPTFTRWALRNSSRRRVQGVFVMMGLAASAMVFVGAQAIGDSLQFSLTNRAASRLGQVGAVVTPLGEHVPAADLQKLAQAGSVQEMVQSLTQTVTLSAKNGERIAVGVNLIGLGPSNYVKFQTQERTIGIEEIAASKALLNRTAAKQLGVSAGDAVQFSLAGSSRQFTVQAVIDDKGLVLDGGALVLPIVTVQELLNRQGAVSQVFAVFKQGEVPGYFQVSPAVSELRTALASQEQADVLAGELGQDSVKRTLAARAARLNPKTLVAIGAMRLQDALNRGDRAAVISLLYEPELQFWLKGLDLAGVSNLNSRLDKLATYKVADVRNDEIRSAQAQAQQMTSLLMVFGVFGIASGIVLVFLIISLLVQERIREIGILRAIGAKRRQVTMIVGSEGMVYSLLGAVAGVGIGLAVAYLLIRWMVGASAITTFSVSMGSVLTALGGSLLLNGISVLIAAYSASGVRVSEAARGSIQPGGTRNRRLRLIVVAVYESGIPLLMCGALAFAFGMATEWVSPVMLGITLLFVGVCQLLGAMVVWLGATKSSVVRSLYTIVGIGVLLFWAVPTSMMQLLGLATFKAGLEVILLAGAMEVLGAICLISQQARLVFGLAVLPFRLVRRWVPIAHYASASASESPKMNARTVAMVSLISFVVVMVFTTTHAMTGNKDYPDMWLRGYNLQVFVPGEASAEAILREVPGVSDMVEAVGSRVTLPVLVHQEGTDSDWIGYQLTVGDDGYLKGAATYGSKVFMRAKGYDSDAAVWRALRGEPGVAVITADAVERRQNYSLTGSGGSFVLNGFYAESKQLPDVSVAIRDPQSGQKRTYRVIGVVASASDTGLLASDNGWDLTTHAASSSRSYFVRANEIRNVSLVQQKINQQLSAQNVAAVNMLDAFYAQWDEAEAENRVLGSFAGMGLFVGLAAIGVLAARAVVTRRQQIGVLRALGFKRLAVLAIFLIESSVLALAGLAIGTVPALTLSYDVVRQLGKESPAFHFNPPTGILVAFLLGSFLMSFMVTVIASWQATSISPAEALRYE